MLHWVLCKDMYCGHSSYLSLFMLQSNHFRVLVQCHGQRAKSLKASIKDRAKTFTAIHTILKRSDVAPEDLRQLTSFNNTSDEYLTPSGQDLRLRSKRASAFFKTLEKPSVKAIVSKDNFLPGADKFIQNFVSTYLAKKDVRNHLLVGLMQAYIAKVNGHRNPIYGTAVTNFYLSLAGCGSKSAVEFASANLGQCISIRHLQRVQATKRPPPFIQHSIDDLVNIVLSQFEIIRTKFGDET